MAAILLSGASGFVGTALATSLTSDGHRVIPLTRSGRRSASGESVAWDPELGQIDHAQLRNARPEIVINLAGEPIDQRWTARRKAQIRASRIRGTDALARALASIAPPARVFVSGSAVGFYGSQRGDELLDEGGTPGSDFLAQTAADWESATAPASAAGIRVALARTGIVVGAGGGALGRMLPIFRMGLGGRLGSGDQWMSWIARDDMVRALRFLADTPTLHGPINLVSPEPVTNRVFTKTLGRVLHRPVLLPVPAFALQLVFGSMARHTILASQRAFPKRLAGAGFEFRHPRLEEALRFELRR